MEIAESGTKLENSFNYMTGFECYTAGMKRTQSTGLQCMFNENNVRSRIGTTILKNC